MFDFHENVGQYPLKHTRVSCTGTAIECMPTDLQMDHIRNITVNKIVSYLLIKLISIGH